MNIIDTFALHRIIYGSYLGMRGEEKKFQVLAIKTAEGMKKLSAVGFFFTILKQFWELRLAKHTINLHSHSSLRREPPFDFIYFVYYRSWFCGSEIYIPIEFKSDATEEGCRGNANEITSEIIFSYKMILCEF